MRLAQALVLSGLIAGAADAAPAFTDLQLGVVCTPQFANYVDAPETTSGYTNIAAEPLEIRWPQTTVPAALGISFGLHARARDEAFTAQIRLSHPAFPGSDRGQEIWFSNFWPDSDNAVFYSFEFDYELVPGDWLLELVDSDSGAVLMWQEFNIVPATDLPHIVQACSGPELVS